MKKTEESVEKVNKKEKTTTEKKIKKTKSELKEEIKELNKKEKAVEQNDEEKNKVKEIIEKAKSKGKITYGELASQLDEANPEQIDKVFDAFEDLGVDILQEDFEEPDVEDLQEVEDIKLEEIDLNTYELGHLR